MQREIKIPYALKCGEWAHISQVESGLKANCICPCCKSSLVARKGNKVTHHFAHYDTTNCKPETALHFIAKTFLFEKILKHLDSRTPLPVAWPCGKCGKLHEANLLRKATQVRLEHDLGYCKPDVLLLTEANIPVAAIEVVVTHKPEESALAYYLEEGIALIEFEVHDGEALEMIRVGEALLATRINQCISPKCKDCHMPLRENHLIIDTARCRRCERQLKVCFIQIAENYTLGTNKFTDDQIRIARELGVCLERQYSQTLDEEYIANTCPTCRTWVGEHFLHFMTSDYALRKQYRVGYHCIVCSRDWPCKTAQVIV